jgi:hypothetical protein
MTIETIRKKYTVDFAYLYNDYVITKSITISMTDFQKRFEFDNIRKEIEEVFYDNMSSYTDNFINDMISYFTDNVMIIAEQSEIELLREKNEQLLIEIDSLKNILEQNKLLIMEVLKKL